MDWAYCARTCCARTCCERLGWRAGRDPLMLHVHAMLALPDDRFANHIAFCLTLLALAGITLLAGCSAVEEDPEPEPEPRFGPGEYGGDPIEGTEELYNLNVSPDGERVALIRARTPGAPFEARDQLWIVDRDGTNPELIGTSISGADWAPDGNRLALNTWRGISAYMFTLDLESGEHVQWSGDDEEAFFFSKTTASVLDWFKDGRRCLVSVWGGAFEQSFERGTYVLDTETGGVEGPLVELMHGSRLGNDERYIIGGKLFAEDEGEAAGNAARFDFADSTWHWITDFPPDSLQRFVDSPVPSPTRDKVVQPRRAGNAEQLFLMDHRGEGDRPITEYGWENPNWTPSGDAFIFKRDVHRGEGAHYVPYRFDLKAMEAEPLWPALPDSVPDFPPLST